MKKSQETKQDCEYIEDGIYDFGDVVIEVGCI